MHALTNTWIFALPELEIARSSPRLEQETVHAGNAHAALAHLALHELDEGGLYESVLSATLRAIMDASPGIEDAPDFPDRITITYASFVHRHVYPGGEDLLVLSTTQPPVVWLVRARLDSPTRWPAVVELVNRP